MRFAKLSDGLSDGIVTLSPLCLDDVDAHLAGGDERLVRWLSGMPSTRASVEAYIRHCREQWVTGGPLRSFGIRTVAETIVGTIDLRFDGEGLASGQVNVAYGLYPSWRGRGLATRAVDLVCQYAAEHGATEAVIKVEPENSASARVALRAGFAFVRRICEQDGTVFDRYERVLRAKMHADEVDIDEDLVRRLLRAQFPQWADLPIAPVRSAGTDNAMYRLGEDLAVRIPRIGWAIESLRTEQQWLPRIAAHLALPAQFRWGWGARLRGSVGRGQCAAGLRVRTRRQPSSSSPIGPSRTWLTSSPPYGPPTPWAGRPPSGVRRWGSRMPRYAQRWRPSTGSSTSTRQLPRGNQPTRSSVCGAADVVPR